MTSSRHLLLLLLIVTRLGYGAESLVTTAATSTGEPVPYILDAVSQSPPYAIILFPGGNGVVNPHLENGRLVYEKKGNFLLRARKYLADDKFATATMNATQVESAVQAVIDDLKAKFPGAAIYLMGTSNGTFDTMALAEYLSDKIAGEIHTSSLSRIASFDARRYRNRHLIVHHRQDFCRATPFSAAEQSHDRFGTDFIVMEGGVSVGDPCEAYAYHGYNGIENETAAAIKRWIEHGH